MASLMAASLLPVARAGGDAVNSGMPANTSNAAIAAASERRWSSALRQSVTNWSIADPTGRWTPPLHGLSPVVVANRNGPMRRRPPVTTTEGRTTALPPVVWFPRTGLEQDPFPEKPGLNP